MILQVCHIVSEILSIQSVVLLVNTDIVCSSQIISCMMRFLAYSKLRLMVPNFMLGLHATVLDCGSEVEVGFMIKS